MARLNTYFILSLSVILINGLAARLRSHHYHQTHHRHPEDNVIHGVRLESEEKEVMMSAEEQPIRFYLHYQSVPSSVRGIIEKVMIEATNYFSQLLKVKPIQVPLLLDRECSTTSQYIERERYCDNACAAVTTCTDATVPTEHLKPCRVCKGQKCAYSTTDPNNAGVPDTDFIIYVTVVDSIVCSTGRSGAYGVVCQTESSLDRPIAGNINFCISEVLKNNSQYMISAAKHEIIHVLGFYSHSYAFYRDEDGNPRMPRDPITNLPLTVKGSTDYDKSNVVTTYTHTNWAVASGTIPHEVKIVITPTVLAKARAHFNCPTMPGLELENQGGPTSAMSHWEARVVGNELMTAIGPRKPQLSELTLALLQDTGWYQVDFSLADPLLWGKNAGCQFVLGSCGGYINSRLSSGRSTEPFCATPTDLRQPPLKYGCTVDRDAVGYCTLGKQSSPIPDEYQYFPQYGPEYGGKVEKFDYCPFYDVFSRSGRVTSCADDNNNPQGTNFLGESYGPGSSCLYEGSKGWSVTNIATSSKKFPYNSGAGCYKVTFASDVTIITVLNKMYQCAQSGQQIDVDITLNGLRYRGSLLCP